MRTSSHRSPATGRRSGSGPGTRDSRLPAPDSPRLADRAAQWRSVYVHIPFCRAVCPYCDFAVVAGGADSFDRYVAAVVTEIGRSPSLGGRIDAVHIGGGTPTSLDPPRLGTILEAIDRHFGLAEGAEIAIEANPEDVDRVSAAALARLGVDRVSLGVQSFDPAVLRELGRTHSPQRAREAVEASLESFRSVSIDLILGTPGESVAAWQASVVEALELGIHHLSTYALTVERGTPLSRAVAAGAPGPDPDDQAEKWELATSAAAAAGMYRYEVSNHARPGHHSRYNLATWAQASYAGVGLGAHRHIGGERSWNVRRLDRYLERVEQGMDPTAGRERREGWAREVERVMLGIRRSAGVEPGRAGAALRASAAGALLIDAGVISGSGRLKVTRPLLGDEASRALLALSPGEC